MSKAVIPSPPKEGLQNIKFGRNGVIVDGACVASVADFGNMIAGRRRKIHFVQHCKDRSYEGDVIALRTLFHTSPAVHQVRCSMTFAPSDVNCSATWTIDGTDQKKINIAISGDETFVDQVFVTASNNPLSAAEDHEAYLTLSNGAVPVSITIYETQSKTLDLTSQPALDTGVYAVGNAITDYSLLTQQSQAETLYTHGGNAHVAWSILDGEPRLNATTTWKNVIDNGTGGWSAIAPGWEYWPRNRGQFISPTITRCKFWAYIYSDDPDGVCEVRFTNSAGVVASISGADEGYYTTMVDVAANVTSDHMIAEFRHTGSGTNAYLVACGFFDYWAPDEPIFI